MSEATIPIKELMEKTEQWLLGQGYKKSTLGFYRATWNRFLSYSASPAYSRETAEQFLLQYFGVDVHAIDQTLDGRMRHARRHMNALDEIFRTGTVCRRKVYGVASIDDDCFDKFFSDYLSYCKMQNFSRSWMDNTIAALRLFLLAVHSSNTQNIKSINAETINCFSTAMSNASEICMNVRRARCRQVGAYLHWLYDHKYTDLDYSLQLPNFKRTAPQIPQVWSPEEIDKILAVIDTANPVGRRNYAIFLLLARTGLRISDVLGLKFSNINWKENCISLSQQKTGNALSLPLSKELGMAIISYLQDGRPQSSSAFIFLSHNAPFQPLGEHNNFNPEFHKYLRRAGIAIPTMKTLDPKKAENKAEKAAVNGSAEDASVSAPSVQIDLSKVKIEPLFADDVDFETFSKSDFRVVKIEACEAVPKSKKLLKFTLNDGTDRKRTILSGIHEYYGPEELVGKTCVAITNLPPRKMMGIDSEGMLISAVYEYDGREGLNLLMLDDSIPAGAKLY